MRSDRQDDLEMNPGMPVGSPGMEAGSRVDPYDVLLVDRSGQASVFTHYPAG